MRNLGRAGLSYAQVFLLVFGFGAASALIFVSGVWVGRDLGLRQAVPQERLVRAAIPTAAPAAPSSSPEDTVNSAFFRRLQEEADQRLAREAAQPAGSGEVAPGVAAPPAEAPLRAPEAEAAAPPPAPMFTMVPPTRRPTQRPTATVPRLPSPTPGRAAPPTRGTADAWGGDGWAVQANATTDQEEARLLAQRLRARGYDAYVLPAPTRGGPTWYRVRVGRFAASDKARATEMERRLRSQENLPNAYIVPR